MPVSDTTAGVPPRPEPRTDLVVTDAPMPADIAAISDALDRFNIEKTGVDDRRPLAILVRDLETHQVIGGLTGRTSLGLFFADLFFLPPELRGSGLGARQRSGSHVHERGTYSSRSTAACPRTPA
ncbi:hypothetical protein ACWD6R_01835 [Streptomyces sp. NPDC005151]